MVKRNFMNLKNISIRYGISTLGLILVALGVGMSFSLDRRRPER